jgi:thioredoxin-related protein
VGCLSIRAKGIWRSRWMYLADSFQETGNMRLNMLRWAAFAVICFMMVVPCGLAVSQEIQWHSYGDGMSRGKFEKKKVYIHFYADWCSACRQMQIHTFKDPDVVALLNEEYIAIRVNTDREQETAIMFRVRALPDNWFIAEDGEIIGHHMGFIPPEQFSTMLKLIKEETGGEN